jgi:hypothetical protein
MAGVAVGTAGCTGDEGTGTPTETNAGTPTQAEALGTVEYTVLNEDDETYHLTVTMENADGAVVQETNEPEFEPGASVSSCDAGHGPDAGPFTLTFSTDSASETYEWGVRECAHRPPGEHRIRRERHRQARALPELRARVRRGPQLSGFRRGGISTVDRSPFVSMLSRSSLESCTGVLDRRSGLSPGIGLRRGWRPPPTCRLVQENLK